jgi:cell division septation protein DedD
LFNVNLRQNDGLLVYEIAANEKISYEAALLEISRIKTVWERSLEEGIQINIDKVGIIYRDREGNIQFEQNSEVNYLATSFGLSPVVSAAIHRERIQHKIEKKIAGYLESPEIRHRVLPASLKWAAILALPIGISALLGIQNFDRIRDFSSAYSGWYSSALDPFKTTIPAPVPAKKVHHSPIHLSAVRVKPEVNIPESPGWLEKKNIQGQVPVKPNPTQIGDQQYSIIVGAFRLRENAVNLVSDLRAKGYDAAIVDTTKTGLTRVRIQAFSDKNEAIQQLAVLRSKDFSGAWLLQK